ncbi:hypothetical protein M011DRAFT_475785 [Sporormia fimetaria CBS 119925]|uniref:Uncharacterized protein n=1 Tax=Sporormia fimetaria CBS 119925 TaxID=1340428 RepID=A0A6A6VGV6_9PLEO|nr:hypothetical protein M011DRAFT_475785 [Sporormia fimetaria CBS 119925]
MDKVKSALHIGSKHKEDKAAALENEPHTHRTSTDRRDSYDSELEAMSPDERIKYLKEFEHAEKHGEAKKGSFLERLILRGNKKTEEEIERERAAADQVRARQPTSGTGAL